MQTELQMEKFTHQWNVGDYNSANSRKLPLFVTLGQFNIISYTILNITYIY